jgi:hypothetical protein
LIFFVDIMELTVVETNINNDCFSSMNMNLLAFLADLFNVMEIHPAKCVCFPGSSQGNLSLKDRKYIVLSQNCSILKLS